jgi:hypothetical protein
MIWLGDKRGYLSDWVTQRWVQLTGRSVKLADAPWLAGPIGKTTSIGSNFYEELAIKSGLELKRGEEVQGLVPRFDALAAPDFDPTKIQRRVAEFYEHASAYELDVWSEWCGLFRPFGYVLALLFSRRLQQLNVPLSGLDTSRGISSEVLQLVDPATGEVKLTAWVRRLLSNQMVLYAGSYSFCHIPNRVGACVKVVFPLPNGSAIVLMKPVANADGSFSLYSVGERFGDPGFYFTVRKDAETLFVRYVKAMREHIRVYEDDAGSLRTDHVLTIWGQTFLHLHYRMRLHTAPLKELVKQ